MNQRSSSLLHCRYRTPRGENNGKQSQSSHIKQCQINNMISLHMNQRQIDQYLSSHNLCLCCINHTHKKGQFEENNDQGNQYCGECAVKMVKHGLNMVPVDQHVLLLRGMVDEQLTRITIEEQYVGRIIKEYYDEIKLGLDKIYKEAREKVIDKENYQDKGKLSLQLELVQYEARSKVQLQSIVKKLGMLKPWFLVVSDANEQSLIVQHQLHPPGQGEFTQFEHLTIKTETTSNSKCNTRRSINKVPPKRIGDITSKQFLSNRQHFQHHPQRTFGNLCFR